MLTAFKALTRVDLLGKTNIFLNKRYVLGLEWYIDREKDFSFTLHLRCLAVTEAKRICEETNSREGQDK